SGEITRPIQQIIPTQAATTLSMTGGHGSNRVGKYELHGFVSFDSAYVEVGGSLDDVSKDHATYAYSTIENLNIMDVIKADKVVSRLTAYTRSHEVPMNGEQAALADQSDGQPRFSLIGSHFENLRINGQPFNVELATEFIDGKYATYDSVAKGYKPGSNKNPAWLFGAGIDTQLAPTGMAEKLGHNYNLINNVSRQFKAWDIPDPNAVRRKTFWCCAAKFQPPAADTQLVNFGGVISVPRFGIIFLCELVVRDNHRHFHMIRVQMGSPAGATITGGGTGGGGGSMPPGV